MGVRYYRFRQMCGHYLANRGHLSEKFMKEFSKLIHMAGYLAEVDREACRIYEEYEQMLKAGMMYQ